MQKRSAHPGRYEISLPTKSSTTKNTVQVCRRVNRKNSGVISNFILLIIRHIIALRLLLLRRGIMMAIDEGRVGGKGTILSRLETQT